MAEYNQSMTDIVRNEYRTFSPTDISLFVAGEEVGTATGLRFQIIRDKQPNYAFGSVSPLAYSRGIRMVTGSMSELVMQGKDLRSALAKFMGENYIYRPGYDSWRKMIAEQHGGTFEKEIIENIERAKVTGIIYMDELYPFDLICVGIDEFGNIAKIELLGCEFVSKGVQISVNDATAISDAMEFVCRDAKPMYHVEV
jgi:hypothetical protein